MGELVADVTVEALPGARAGVLQLPNYWIIECDWAKKYNTESIHQVNINYAWNVLTSRWRTQRLMTKISESIHERYWWKRGAMQSTRFLCDSLISCNVEDPEPNPLSNFPKLSYQGINEYAVTSIHLPVVSQEEEETMLQYVFVLVAVQCDADHAIFNPFQNLIKGQWYTWLPEHVVQIAKSFVCYCALFNSQR